MGIIGIFARRMPNSGVFYMVLNINKKGNNTIQHSKRVRGIKYSTLFFERYHCPV